MTPKEKGDHLVMVYYGHTMTRNKAINCAIIHVNGIIEELERLNIISHHWQSVLTELNNL